MDALLCVLSARDMLHGMSDFWSIFILTSFLIFCHLTPKLENLYPKWT